MTLLLLLTLQARTLLDAHNCYPYEDQWANRIERALSTGTPLAIEQDLAWYVDKTTGKAWSVVSHDSHPHGNEPTMKQYFFERIRPIIEEALKNPHKSQWPLITLNLDFKTLELEHARAVWQLLGEYEPWLTTSKKHGKKLDLKPILVLAGEPAALEKVFYQEVPGNGRLRVFGAAKVNTTKKATPYYRWWNSPWANVEPGGQTKAGEWTPEEEQRLKSIVGHAHKLGYWMRFYTLNGHAPAESQGWSSIYNFGSLEAVRKRWEACIRTGVDYLATDQYEDFAAFLSRHPQPLP